MLLASQQRTLVCLFVAAVSLTGQSWEQDMEFRVERLVQKHGNGTDQALRDRLAKMAKRDQAVRKPEYVTDKASPELVREQERVDAELTAELKDIVQRKGWPTIKLVGMQASEHAALILSHSRDHDFQRSMLPRLQALADEGEILGSSVAFLIDKVLISEGKAQRFGTQFKWGAGIAEMLPVEDADHLEERRSKYFLPPLAEYKKTLSELYKVQVR
jgi:hypothetical protein